MENIPTILSIAYFTVGITSVFLGGYIFFVSAKKNIRWPFLFTCIALGVWSLGFSMMVSAPNEEACLFWRQISALGWGSFFSVFFHFILQMTERKNLLKKWWIYPLVYLPSAITLSAFSFYTGLNPAQYNLVHTPLGWTNVATNNAWDWFYLVYYTSVMLICLVLIWEWRKHSSNTNVKKQTRLILAASSATVLLGTATDIVANAFFSVTIPQLGPIIMVIPIVAINYSIKKYGFMNPRPVYEDQIILNENSRSRIYNYLPIAFVIGGLLNYIANYIIEKNDIQTTLAFSAVLCLMGVVLFVIRQLRVGENTRTILLTTVFTLFIPIITLRFIDNTGISIWAFPFILIIVSLVFNKRYMLVAVCCSTIATQIIAGLLHPRFTVQVNSSDYIVRIGLFLIGVWLSSYVNKAFFLRLKENTHQTNYQKLVSEISFDFLNIDQSTLDAKAKNLLKKTGMFFQADRAYVYLYDQQQETMQHTYEWRNKGIEPGKDAFRDIPLDSLAWWLGQIEDVSKLSEEHREIKEKLIRKQIKSLITIPIEGEGITYGFMGFDFVKSPQKWPDKQLKMLNIFANLLADGMRKVRAEKEIEYMAYYDHLTGLPNRTLFTDRVNQAIHLARRCEKFIGVMFVDLDSFKNVNDTMGHNGGDILIKEVANTLSKRLRKMDTVARFGSDEFLIMLNNISDGKDVARIAQSIMKIFEDPFMIEGQEFFITGSAGVALYPMDGEDTDTLVKNADIAMYKAKSAGKNQYVFCTSDMKDEVQRNMMLTNSLYRAQERDELLLYYQPQVDLKTKQIVGLEALLRWKHPKLGMLLPGLFISLAEKNGLINSIGDWVLKTACAQNKKWQDMGLQRLRMAVNLSVNQFKCPNLVENVKRTLKDTGLNPEYLELEITESVAIKEAEDIVSILNNLKKLGLSISIDDFGTEYSSLSRLKTLPIDRIKIDMQFVQGIEDSEKDQAITKIIINLAKNLRLKVIAEGVETIRQLDFLRQKMCDEVQGYYYYRPMPPEAVEELLKSLPADLDAETPLAM